MRKSDVSNSGDLDLHEFVTYLTEHEKQLKISFSKLDEDKDGKISVAEVVSAFKRLGIVITENEAKSLMQRYVFIYPMLAFIVEVNQAGFCQALKFKLMPSQT